jgi:hypothetical protein
VGGIAVPRFAAFSPVARLTPPAVLIQECFMPGNDRDQNFEKALAGNLRSSNAAAGNDCLDAETLAAYHERLLDPEGMAQRKAHVATCERCQEILAQLEATDAIPVEADRDLLLDQIVLEIPETDQTPTATPASTSEQSAVPAAPAPSAETASPVEASSQAQSESEAEQLTEAEAKNAPGAEFILDPKLLHDPELVPAFAPASTSEASRAETVGATPVAVAAARMTPASSHTITFRSPRQERPKMVRFVAIAGVLAAGLILWFVYRDQSKESEIALNRPASKIELPPESPAQAPAPQAETKSESKLDNAQSSEPSAAMLKSQPAAAPPAAQSQSAPAKTPGDSMSDSLADAKKTLDTAKALEKKSRRDAAGVMLDQPENAAKQTAPTGRPLSGLMAARAVTGSAMPRAPRSADEAQSSGDTTLSANAPSGISATPPPARTRMNPSVVTDSAMVSGAPAPLAQVSASANGEFVTKPTSGRIASVALAPLSVPAPSGTTIWRIGQAGVIQRSTDSGTTWFIQPSGVVADLIAGSAYSDQVCWLVGRNGTILRTTNGGATWQKLTSPSNVDLLAVFAINADSATVTDAAGRAFETTTGGAHWTRTRLQP